MKAETREARLRRMVRCLERAAHSPGACLHPEDHDDFAEAARLVRQLLPKDEREAAE